MIRLMFMIAYESIKLNIEKVLSLYSCKEKIEYNFKVCTYLDLYDYSLEWPCDAIIARGFSADVLTGQFPDLPVIRLEFSSAEVIETIMLCRDKFNSKHIGVIGYPSLAVAADIIRKISGISINAYIMENPTCDTQQLVHQALADGCDTIVGGGTVYEYAESIGVNAGIIIPSADTLWRGIDEAITAINIQRQERVKTQLLKKVIDNSTGGFILTKPNGDAIVSNKYAEQLLDFKLDGDLAGASLQDLLPELADTFKNSVESWGEVNDVMLKRKGVNLTVSVQPLIINNSIDSVLIVLNDVGKIQSLEHQIRNKLFAKGMVTQYSFDDIINNDARMKGVVKMAQKFSGVDSSVLVTGETGTGKEMFAQSIHAASNRKNFPFVAVNCAAIPEHLLESELFGYAPGAFTGANKNGKHGLFESAHKGTLFLDEISELPLLFQSKLLRVLQEREIRRIGESQVIPVDIRVIAATNRDLTEMVEHSLFRRDLYYRLNVLEIYIPPLCARQEDIFPLFNQFVRQFSAQFSKTPPRLSHQEKDILSRSAWPGNIRELKNVAERFVVLFDSTQSVQETLSECMKSSLLQQAPASSPVLRMPSRKEQERSKIVEALEAVSTYSEAAQVLSMSRSTLYRKMKKLGLK